MWRKLLTIYLIFGVSLAILISLSLYAFQRFNAYIGHAQVVEKNHRLLNHLKLLRTEVEAVTSSQRSYLLFNDSSFLIDHADHEARIRKIFAGLYNLMNDEPEQRKRMQALNLNLRSQLEFLSSGIMAGYPPTDFKREKKYLERFVALTDEIQDAEQKRLQALVATREFYEETTPRNFQVVFVFTLSVFIVSFFLLAQQYRNGMRYQQKLEQNLMDLNQSHAEWEQIAYVASHDLQEPLRKIRTFSDIMHKRHTDNLDAEGRDLVKKIESASMRAQSLMTDIVHYNLVVHPREKLQPVELEDILSNNASELRDDMMQKNALVSHDGLPRITGYPSQVSLLFRCLLENSLKFGRENESVKINISSREVSKSELPIHHRSSFKKYQEIVHEDNGIGFDDRFSEKIFKMFQRLHLQDSEYEGRGIGLPMVKRIMSNHAGFVIARGCPGKGSKFILYFPVR